MEIPFLNLAKQNKKLADDILPIWKEILESARFIGGEHVTSFESEFAVACGAGTATQAGTQLFHPHELTNLSDQITIKTLDI